MATANTDVVTAAEHLVGNLWFQMDAVSVIASRLQPDTMRNVVGGPPAMAYSEMCRLLRSEREQLSAGALEASLKSMRFDWSWLDDLQSRVASESMPVLMRYAATINNAADLRKIRTYCARADQDAQRQGAYAEDVAADLLRALTDQAEAATEVEHISAPISRLRDQFQAMKDGTYDWGQKTGFRAIDTLIRMVDGDLIVLGGRPSQGKSSLARQIALHRAKEILRNGEKGQVVIFTADDTAAKTVEAMAGIEAQVNLANVRTGKATSEDWAKLEDAMQTIELLPIQVDDTTQPTVEQMYYRAAMLNAQAPVKLAIMDYLELVSVPKVSSELERVTQAARGIKSIGSTLGFPYLLLSQLRKDVDDRRDKWPTAADTKYAGEAEADVMMLAMRPEHYINRGDTIECNDEDRQGVALINVAKNKTGQVGVARLSFRAEVSSFGDLYRV